MVQSLYTRLREIEDINSGIQNNASRFDEMMQEYSYLPTYREPELEFPEIDVSEAQRLAILDYEGNPIVKEALEGRCSVTDQFEGLAKLNKGIRKFLPKRKDEDYNQRIELMKQVVGDNEGNSYDLLTQARLNNLKTRGVFSLDNFANGFVFGNIVFGVLPLIFIGNTAYHGDTEWAMKLLNDYGNSLGNNILENGVSPMQGLHTYFGLVGGAFSQLRRKIINVNNGNAQYVDEKIEDLMR